MVSISNKGNINIFLVILISLLILASIGSSFFFYNKYQKSQGSQEQPITDIERVVKAVSALMVLPTGETPTLATISDKTKLQNQPFFKDAENGDRILVYAEAKRAILYRPSINKIIDIAPVVPFEEEKEELPPAKIALYNGSSVSGLTSKIENRLLADEKLGSLVEVVTKESAMGQYQQTLIVDLKGDQEKITSFLVDFLGGIVGSFPAEEILPQDAEIAIFLSSN